MKEESEGKSKKKLPRFASEQEESDFWDTHDSTEYMEELILVDEVFVDARPTISIRLEAETIAKLKEVARRKRVDYRTMIRWWVIERLKQEQW